MADTKLSAEDPIDAIAAGDLFYVVDDPSGTPTPKKATAAQIKTSVLANFNVVQQVFTASGTYTPTSGMLYCIIECLGGGGGAGGASSSTATTSNGGGGGGAGGYSRSRKTATDIGASQTVTIGAAGTGGSAGANNGAAGGDTSVGTLVIAKGGSFGGGSNAASMGASGAGGVAGTGDIAGTGENPFPGTASPSTATTFGTTAGGASTLWGRGGGSRQVSANVTGAAGSGYGAGGEGGASWNNGGTAAGGAGTAGLVVITEYCA